ncbi:hypothetical protein HK101_004714 [Irineochytrium annulatum]|nr:hypothetical protein HK101_004714 [Irineochytrium annulatum]
MGDATAAEGDPASSLVLSRIMLVVYAVGLPLNVAPASEQVILVAAYVKHRRDLLVRTIDYLFLLVVLVHLIWCVCFVWIQAYITLTLDGFAASGDLGFTLCQAAGIILLETAGNAIAVHMLMSIDRWLIVVARFRDSRPTLITIAVAIEVMFASIVVVQMRYSRRAFEPAESGLYCFFPFFATDGDYTDLTVTIFASGFCVVAASVIASAYAHIYFTAIRINRVPVVNNTSSHGSSAMRVNPVPAVVANTNSSSHNSGHGQQNTATSLLSHKYANEVDARAIFFRCIGVVSVFMITYMFEFTLFGYKLIGNAPVAQWVDGLAATMTAVDTAATPILIVVMNNKVLKAFEDVVGFRLPPWRKDEDAGVAIVSGGSSDMWKGGEQSKRSLASGSGRLENAPLVGAEDEGPATGAPCSSVPKSGMYGSKSDVGMSEDV